MKFGRLHVLHICIRILLLIFHKMPIGAHFLLIFAILYLPMIYAMSLFISGVSNDKYFTRGLNYLPIPVLWPDTNICIWHDMIEMMRDNAYDKTEQLINNWYCQFQYKNPMANTDTDAKISNHDFDLHSCKGLYRSVKELSLANHIGHDFLFWSNSSFLDRYLVLN